jgi:cytochrome c556
MINTNSDVAVMQYDKQVATPAHEQSTEASKNMLHEVISSNMALEAHASGKNPFDPNVPLSNFSQVSSDVYRSGRPNGVEGLKDAVDKMWGDKDFDPAHAKMTTVIDLRCDTKNPQNNEEIQQEIANSAKLGIAHERIPMDAQAYQPPAFIQSVLDNIDQQKSEGHRVLIHCHLGRDRTGTISAAYELTHNPQMEQLLAKDPAAAFKAGLKTMTDDGYSPQQLPELAKSLKDFVNWKHAQEPGAKANDAVDAMSLKIPSLWG